ncbi:hypothetical protein N9C06_05950 [Salibacteraceae bacterium]|nr:hypothetical protein [Salibacteraceae bacterium]
MNALKTCSILLLSFLGLSSCETDVNVNADYQAVPIIYGLLDVTDSVHQIKINKTFLGEMDAREMATVRDSSEFQNVNAIIESWSQYGNKERDYLLEEVEITNKDSGLFYGPNQSVFQFVDNQLSSTSTYKLIVDINSGSKIARAETKLVNFRELYRTTDWARLKATGLRFADSDTILGGHEIHIVPPTNSKRVQVRAIFNYTDVINDGGNQLTFDREISFNLGTEIVENAYAPKEERFFFTGKQFFDAINLFVPDFEDTKGLVHRIPEDMDFEVTIAGEDLHVYMEVNEPSGDLNQEKPEYTNVEGGYGIFSSRMRMLFSEREVNSEIRLSKGTIEELVSGVLGSGAGTKGFCNSSVGTAVPNSCF